MSTLAARWRQHPVVTRSAWTLIDQAASSGSNFILALWILAVARPAQFASFSVAITGYLLVTQLTRSALSLPVMILYSSDDAGEVARQAGPAVAATMFTGLAGSVFVVLTGAALGAGIASFVIVACFLPLLQYQDAVRHVAFASARPKAAAGADGVWVGLQVAGSLVAVAAGHATPGALVLAWAVAGSVSGVLFGARLRVMPAVSRCRGWFRKNYALCRRLSVEFVLNSGSYYGLSYGLVLVAGAEQLGRMRAAQSLIGPVSVLLLGGTTLGVPETVRVRDEGPRLQRFAVFLSVGLTALAVAGGLIAYLILPTVGPAVFPDTWATARPVLPVLTAYAAAVGASTGALAALRARGDAAWIVRRRAASGVAALVLGLALAARWGATGALTGLGVAEWGFAAAAWARLRASLTGPVPPLPQSA